MYLPRLISIPFVLSQIWPEQASIMKKNGYGEITLSIYKIVLVHCPFLHCYLSINQVSFQSLLYFQRYGPDKVPDGQTDKEAFHSGEHKNVTYEFIEKGNILF